MAIHHLAHPDKVRMYSAFYTSLKFGGLFLNYDVSSLVGRSSAP
jgi:Tfp pilus assembly protein PilZ